MKVISSLKLVHRRGRGFSKLEIGKHLFLFSSYLFVISLYYLLSIYSPNFNTTMLLYGISYKFWDQILMRIFILSLASQRNSQKIRFSCGKLLSFSNPFFIFHKKKRFLHSAQCFISIQNFYSESWDIFSVRNSQLQLIWTDTYHDNRVSNYFKRYYNLRKKKLSSFINSWMNTLFLFPNDKETQKRVKKNWNVNRIFTLTY